MLRGGRVRSGNGTLESPIALVPCPVVATMSSVLPVTRRFPTGRGCVPGKRTAWPEEEAERNEASLLGGVRLALNPVTAGPGLA